ncbi:acyl carrier protein [Streptacidiphilus cavernicola]|uniref:Acyl carrier protein n=1 Tax=Streptacidiphilus cavernicola TaxID=3342716 RepID=A0ABV6VSI5_9ACTN
MNEEQLTARIAELLCGVLRDRTAEQLQPDSWLLDHPRYDSLGMVEVLVRLEEEFDLEVVDEIDPRAMATPRALAALVAAWAPRTVTTANEGS